MPLYTARSSATVASVFVVFSVAIGACSARSDLEAERDARNAKLPAGEAAAGSEGRRARRGQPTDGTFDPSAGCSVDADCLRVSKGCCNLGEYVAVTKANAEAYQQSLSCESVSCPLVMVTDDGSVARCNATTNACEIVLPVQRCGGFAGLQCDDPGARCVDDPDDDCDPEKGGADCGGLCVP